VDSGRMSQADTKSTAKKSTENKSLLILKSISPMRLWQSWKRLQEKSSVMDKFIRTYPLFTPEVCGTLIETFDSAKTKERVDNFLTPQFTQVNVNELANKGYQKFTQLLCYKVLEAVKQYKKDLPEYTEWFPEKILFEELRIKKYEPGTDDQFDIHVDVQDHQSAKRYLAFLVYLNNDFKGGETTFPYHNLTVKPETGKVLVFPPTWQYPHIGLPVKSGKSKYVMSTYLHYN